VSPEEFMRLMATDASWDSGPDGSGAGA
jgi:hypothetical protein